MLTLKAHKGKTADTRGLRQQDETSDIEAFWNEGDRVAVLSATGQQLGTMVPTSTGSATTTLKAELTTPVSQGDQLILQFPRTTRDYTGQKGTLADIAANYDYATADVKVLYADDSFVSATDAHFINHQAIVRFNLINGTQALEATSLTIDGDGLIQKVTAADPATTGPVTVTPQSAASEIYAALSGLNGMVTLTAVAGNRTYTATSTQAQSFADGRYYRFTVDMQRPSVAYPEPLTLECFNSIDGRGCYVTVNYPPDELQYTTDGGTTWKDYTSKRIWIAIGGKVSFRGTGTKSSSSNYMNIKCDGDCYVYGNVMSLLSHDFATMTELPYANTFQNLFMDNQYITHVEGKDLVLPAYELKKSCYYQMFYGCKNFNYVKCLATDISKDNCTHNWLYNTAKKGTFVRSADFAGWPVDERNAQISIGIPYGWTVLQE